MRVTTDQLRQQIKKARGELIALAKTWLESERQNKQPLGESLNFELKDWLIAVSAASSDEMQQVLKTNGFPLERMDSINTLPVPVLVVKPESQPNESLDILTRVYEVNATKPSELLNKLCQLTNLFEQLHHLDESLTPLDPPILLNGLHLACAMAKSINEEWCFVEPGVQTVEYYKQRVQEAHAQLTQTQKANTDAFELLEMPMEIRSRQFDSTLRFIAQYMGDIYADIQDNRRLVAPFGFRLRGYLPWQQMINQVATSLFGSESVYHPGVGSLTIRESILTQISTAISEQTKNPFKELEEAHNTLSEEAKKELTRACTKLKSMAKTNAIQLDFNTRRETVAHLMSTQKVGLYSFFQSLHSIHRFPLAESLTQDNRDALNGSRMGFNQ